MSKFAYLCLALLLTSSLACSRKPNDETISENIQSGFDEPTVRRVVRQINLNAYKRRQAAPGLKVTTKAFGVGRRVPVAQRHFEG